MSRQTFRAPDGSRMEVVVDLEAIANHLARRVRDNASGRATALGGAVVARRLPPGGD